MMTLVYIALFEG